MMMFVDLSLVNFQFDYLVAGYCKQGLKIEELS